MGTGAIARPADRLSDDWGEYNEGRCHRRSKYAGRFASARDTAKALGVSASRTEELIATARHLTARLADRRPDTGLLVKSKDGVRTPATSSRKSSRRNAQTNLRKTRSVRSKARA